MNRIISIMFVLLAMGTSLIAQTTTAPSSGDGSSGAPYQIGTLSNLYWITQNPDKWDAYYIQTANIDASSTISWDGGAGLTPIGNSSTKFTGWYDGDGYTISNLFINRPSTDYVGLFGYTQGATLRDLGVTSVIITGADYVGGLVAYTRGNSTTLSNCYSTGSVTGNGSVGGLLGFHYQGTVSNCYSTGSVTGASDVGGLVGYLRTNSIVSNSFYNSTTSGQSDTGKGTPKTTAEMKVASPFTAAGWDFEIETVNGSNNYWDMDNVNGAYNSGYPFLSWENGSTVLVSMEGVLLAQPPSAGTGSSTDPYQIGTLSNLYWITQNPDKWDA